MNEKATADSLVTYKFSAEDDPWSTYPSRFSRWRLIRQSHLWRPPTDVLETDEAYVVIVEVAGMRGAEFSVTYNQQVLSIQGTRSDTSVRKAYHQMEIAHGEFETEVRIPDPIDASNIEATYSDGFLRVVLSKTRPRQVSISD